MALLAGCATTQGRFAAIGATYPARATDHAIDVFKEGLPTRAYVKVARLDAHLEKAGWVVSDLDEALVELKRQARLAGGDAIIDIREQRSRINETRVLHVSATGIRYTD